MIFDSLIISVTDRIGSLALSRIMIYSVRCWIYLLISSAKLTTISESCKPSHIAMRIVASNSIKSVSKTKLLWGHRQVGEKSLHKNLCSFALLFDRRFGTLLGQISQKAESPHYANRLREGEPINRCCLHDLIQLIQPLSGGPRLYYFVVSDRFLMQRALHICRLGHH